MGTSGPGRLDAVRTVAARVSHMGQPPEASSGPGPVAPGAGPDDDEAATSPGVPETASPASQEPVAEAPQWPAPDQQWQQPHPDGGWQQPTNPQGWQQAAAQGWQQPASAGPWPGPGAPGPGAPTQAATEQWQQHGWAQPGTGGQPAPQGQPGVPPVPPAPPTQQQPASVPTGRSMYGVRPEPQQPQPQPQGGYGQFTFPVAPRQPLEPLAVAGVATSPLGPVGIVLGLLARGRVRRTRRRSMGLAWTGVALGALFTVVWALVGTALTMNGTIDRALERPQEGDVAEARTIAAANLAVGNCIATLPPAQQVGEVRLVPCAEEHIAQVVTLHELSGDFPGDAALADQAVSTCTTDVAQVDDGDASIVPWYLVPSAAGWEQGNTQVVCLLRGDAGPLHVDLVNS